MVVVNLLHNAIALFGDDRLFGHRNGAILQRVVRLPEQELTVVFKTLVQGAHDDNGYHRTDEAADAVDAPLVEQDHLGVSKVELFIHEALVCVHIMVGY